MSPMIKRVSAVIRNRNEAHHMAHVLTALAHQSEPLHEVVVVDNESSDSSIALAERFGARIVKISRSEFTYGRALNVGIAASSGDAILILSAHSLPIGPHFVCDAVSSLDRTGAAAVRCRDIRVMD